MKSPEPTHRKRTWPSLRLPLLAACSALLAIPVSALAQTSAENTPRPEAAAIVAENVAAAPAPPVCGSPLNVGYYEMCIGQGSGIQVAPITAAGHNAVNITTLSAAELAGIDVLFVDNCDNDGYGAEYIANLAAIDAAVNAGLVLIIHDRHVDVAETILPGGAAFNVTRDFGDAANIDVRDNTTIVTSGGGPGGAIGNATLDGGDASSHGYTTAASLAGACNAKLILSRGNTDEIVTFSYAYGAGSVIYSTIPLDYYLSGEGPAGVQANMVGVYAPNVIAYGACLVGAGSGCCKEPMYSTASYGTGLATIDTSTGTGAVVGLGGDGGTWAAAIDNATGTLYTTLNWGEKLGKFDLGTGAVTVIGALGVADTVIALEVAADGTLYAGGWSGNLYTVNKSTGAATQVGAGGVGNLMDYSFDLSGKLWGTDGGNLFTVDTATGAATYVTTISGAAGDVMGLAFGNDGVLYATAWIPASPLYKIDTTTGVATVIGSTGLDGPHGGDIRVCQDNQPPVAVCTDVYSNCGGDISAEQIAGGSSDPDGDAITITVAPPGPYPVGVTEVTVTVSDGVLESTCTATVTVEQAETSVSFVSPKTFWVWGVDGTPTIKASSSSECELCDGPVDFWVDVNGDGAIDHGEVQEGALGEGGSWSVTLPGVGIYCVQALYGGSEYCAASATEVLIVSVVSPDDLANGGGRYARCNAGGGNPNVVFGFTTQWDRKASAYRGNVLVQNHNRWRVKGKISAYAQTSTSTGEATGLANVYWWDETLDDGEGGWSPLASDVQYKISFVDIGNTLTKKRNGAKLDSFSLTYLGLGAIDSAILDAVGTPPVCGAPQELRNGNVSIHLK